jgi:hypothetical protein
MEINDPHKTELIAGGWYMTTGHIVKEMIQGKHKINDGDDANSYVPHNKLTPPIAGDLTGNASAPTYWSFRSSQLDLRVGLSDNRSLLGRGGGQRSIRPGWSRAIATTPLSGARATSRCRML